MRHEAGLYDTTMPQNDEARKPPPWLLPPDLATIVADDGEWEDPSWDPILLTAVGETRHEGRRVPLAWQLSLWPTDPFFADLNAALAARGEKPDGHGWSDLLHAAIAARDPALASRLHDDSDAATCVIWVETEADGRALMEIAWVYLHAIKAAV